LVHCRFRYTWSNSVHVHFGIFEVGTFFLTMYKYFDDLCQKDFVKSTLTSSNCVLAVSVTGSRPNIGLFVLCNVIRLNSHSLCSSLS